MNNRHYQTDVNQITFNHPTLWNLALQIFEAFIECESFLQSNSPDILTLCETNLDDSIDFSNFSVRGYPPYIQKDSNTHMNGL